MHLLQRNESFDSNNSMRTELKVFLAFQIIGGLGNAAMLLTALISRRVVRHCTWINFCLTWVIYCLSYTLLFFGGQQTNSASPNHLLCVTQAALVYGAPVLTSLSSLAIVIQVWLFLRQTALSQDMSKRSLLRTILFILVPYIAWFAVAMTAFISGTLNSKTVMRATSDVYCEINTTIPGHVSTAISSTVVIVAIGFQVIIARMLQRMHWRVKSEYTKYPGFVSLSMVIRLGSFKFIVLSCLAASEIIIFVSKSSMAANISLSLMPVAAFFLFATQRDILRVWTFRD